jgi:D-glycero-D-manno-heptose 1,7-bisphosphate phosphatase
MTKAVFLDRDGTIIVDKNYLNDPEQIEFLPGAIEGLQALQKEFLLIVVTNQSGIARGLVQPENLRLIHEKMQTLLQSYGVQITAFYHSPHSADSDHPMRKPNPGMLLQSAKDHRIDLAASFMIGDKPIDVEAGHRAGVKSILISDTASETIAPEFLATDLLVAAKWILR